MQKGSRTRRRPVGEHAENMGYRSGDVGSNGINTHRMLEQHKYNNFLGTQKTNMQNQQHAKEVNTFNSAFNAAKKGAISDIDPGFKTALANNFQEQCNNQNLGNIGLVVNVHGTSFGRVVGKNQSIQPSVLDKLDRVGAGISDIARVRS